MADLGDELWKADDGKTAAIRLGRLKYCLISGVNRRADENVRKVEVSVRCAKHNTLAP
jgi:hypothetical protein